MVPPPNQSRRLSPCGEHSGLSVVCPKMGSVVVYGIAMDGKLGL